ncbi:endonuclease I family protein [Lederbergia citrea]|uniref:endonuclease I family protein n=1 Tax=Lederbergia citrea TaxID=2833581 RepID=UPI001BC94AF2|nr:endonuclease [Lederbergia citrea]MBS4179285.1 endonuclease [Lederbergia citrea]
MMKVERLESMLKDLEENRIKIRENSRIYYDEELDVKQIQEYYQSFDFTIEDSHERFRLLQSLVEDSHKNRLPYFISKDELYTWVELQPDGTINNIYSGEENNPENLLKQDYEIQNRRQEFGTNEQIAQTIPEEFKFNAEHIVPQSWFAGREPMKGDLHHMFACEPHCNATRSNYAYYDFPYYEPESPNERIQNHCGVASDDLFEPEYGKGTVARAMLYFILRYPDTIQKPYSRKINFKLLRKWNEEFPPAIYEKHRNQAIFKIQGNRNPFIDFPDLVDTLYFPLRR